MIVKIITIIFLPIKYWLGILRIALGGNANITFIISILAFLTTVALVIVTLQYVNYSKKTLTQAMKSLDLSEEKEKIDRTLDFIEKFNIDDYETLQREQSKSKSIYNSKNKELIGYFQYLVEYFDTLAIFYKNDKIDKELFEAKIELAFLNFLNRFKKEIWANIETKKIFGSSVTYLNQNFLYLAILCLDKKRNIDSELKEDFKKDYSFYIKLRDNLKNDWKSNTKIINEIQETQD